MRHQANLSLAQVLPSAAAAVGTPGFLDELGIGENTVVVVCLVDGLGAQAIEQHAELFDALADAQGGSIESTFPTTTPTGLASLGTGLSPGQHGFVGASFWLAEEERILSPLHWGRQPTPEAVQPEPTVFEQMTRYGVQAFTIAPSAYRRSGLTMAVLRGSQYLQADSAHERALGVRQVIASKGPSVAYVYWAALDRAAHEFGTRSAEWRAAAVEVNDLLWLLRSELGSRGTLVVTADHGMVDCTSRTWIEEHPLMTAGVRAIAGEPRMRHIYTISTDEAPEVAQRWQAVLGEEATLMLRREAIGAGLFGSVDPAVEERIGDVIAIAQGQSIMASRTFDERVSLLSGHHGARTDDERRVPALLVRG